MADFFQTIGALPGFRMTGDSVTSWSLALDGTGDAVAWIFQNPFDSEVITDLAYYASAVSASRS